MATKLEGMHSFGNSEAEYYDAERLADEWAGDNEAYAVVIEDYENDRIHVMDFADAEGFMAEWDSRVIYRADHRPRCSFCEHVITGIVILSSDKEYCSFSCIRLSK